MTLSNPRQRLACVLLPGALALALGACAPKPAEPVAAPAAPAAVETAPADVATTPAPTDAPEPGATPTLSADCNADAVQGLVGQEGTDAVLEQAKTDSGAKTVRALKPGEPATMDFRPDRLDIALDEQGIIQSLRCG